MYNGIDERKNEYEVNDLHIIKKYFKSFIRIFRIDKRLLLALDSTYRGCTSYYWKVAFLMYAAALESILSYSHERGITKRLAKSYACLMIDNKKGRDKLFKEFCFLYDIRSKIIHGTYRKRSKSNMLYLSRIANMVRMIWQKILFDNNLLSVLEKNDLQREVFFRNTIGSYTPPKILLIH
jgi:hypothetical protein